MRTKDILYRRCLIGIAFILWGMLWAIFRNDLLSRLLCVFFIIFGLYILFKTYFKLRKGEYEDVLTDERSEYNALRAAKVGFEFMLLSAGILFSLLGLRMINEIIFTALMGPVFGIGSLIYYWTYYKHEKGADENQD